MRLDICSESLGSNQKRATRRANETSQSSSAPLQSGRVACLAAKFLNKAAEQGSKVSWLNECHLAMIAIAPVQIGPNWPLASPFECNNTAVACRAATKSLVHVELCAGEPSREPISSVGLFISFFFSCGRLEELAFVCDKLERAR